MGHWFRALPTLLYGLILLVSTWIAGVAEGGVKWEPPRDIIARATGHGSKAHVLPMEEATLPPREELRLVLFVPVPEPELRPGAKAPRTSVQPCASPVATSGEAVPASDREVGRGTTLQQREWQPPPRAPDSLC